MDDIYSYVKEEDERTLYEYSSTERKLRENGARQFLLPGTAVGLFLCVASALFINFSEDALALAVTRGVGSLGGMIFAASLLFYTMFWRQARRAHGVSLYITNKNVILCERGSYAKMPLKDISDARVEAGQRLLALPFDMTALEGVYLVLFYRDADMKIPYIEHAEDAASKIKALVG